MERPTVQEIQQAAKALNQLVANAVKSGLRVDVDVWISSTWANTQEHISEVRIEVYEKLTAGKTGS